METTELIEEINKSEAFASFCLDGYASGNVDDELLLAEFIAKAYLGMRLNPLLEKRKMDKKTFNSTCELFTEYFLEENISLDILINCLYNYINTNHKCPSEQYLSDIQAFLEDYSENDDGDHEVKYEKG